MESQSTSAQEIWDSGRNFIEFLGRPSDFIVSAVRGIRNAQNLFQNQTKVRQVASQLLSRLTNSPSYKTVYYFAAREFYPEELSKIAEVDVSQLLALFTIDELLVVPTIFYLNRRYESLVDETEWLQLQERLRIHCAIGRLVGGHIPEIGSGMGMLMSAMRFFAIGLFLKNGDKPFKEYRRSLKARNLLFDEDHETSSFNTTNSVTAACLLQKLGFGTEAAIAMSHSSTNGTKAPDITPFWVLCKRMTEILHLGGDPFAGEYLTGLPEFKAEGYSNLKLSVASILENPNCFNWIFCSKDDLAKVNNQNVDLLLNKEAQ